MSENIKPCPFCGSANVEVSRDFTPRVLCNGIGCGANGPVAHTIENAIAKWNAAIRSTVKRVITTPDPTDNRWTWTTIVEDAQQANAAKPDAANLDDFDQMTEDGTIYAHMRDQELRQERRRRE